MHDYSFTMNGTATKLKTGYARPFQAHVFRNWIAGHPKIVLPIVVFLLGSVTYAVRIRNVIVSLFVDSKATTTDLRSHSRLDGASEGTQLVRLPGVQSLQVAEREHRFNLFVE